jgi:putative ABC transport system permease protein
VWVRYQDAIAPGSGISRLTFLVQARGRPEELAGSIRELIARLDPELPVLNLQTMDQILYDSTGSPRFYMVLMSTFGGIAILLAAVGFYGVMAYAVGRRTHELGVRVALGASTARIRWMVVRQGALITTIGIGLGLAGCVALAGVLESFLYGISPTDPLTYGVLVVVVAVVGLLACYVPARRATRVDPSIALRDHP